MGYMQGSQTRNKYKNTDSAQNHVDRVRVPDTNCQFGGPGRGSGWRHRSLSNIDLTSQSKHSFTKQTRGYTSSLYDLYSRLEARKDTNDLENLYGNTNTTSAEKVESIYDRIEQTLDTINKSGSCSLRRTRSLAVIREETFNDLQIGSGIRSRRSQLIPRAKLLNRSFFQNRTSNNSTNAHLNGANHLNNNHHSRKKYREEDSGSGVDTQTSETRESDDYYGNLKKVQGSQIIQQGDPKLLPTLWLNDKSDLDSLDSDYFKNSLHQLDGSGIYSAYDSTQNLKDIHGGGGGIGGRLLGTPDVSIAHGYLDDTSSLRSGAFEHSPLPDYCTIQTDENSEKFVSAEDVSVIHVNCGGVDTNTFKSGANNTTGQLKLCDNENRHHCDRLNSDDLDRKPKFKEDHKSVISYDSIYLSSEGSNEAATIIEEEEKINEYLSDNNYSTLSEYTNIKKETKPIVNETIKKDDNNNGNGANDNLYSRINKPQNQTKPIEIEAKTKLTTFSDISNRGTLERLTFISSPAAHSEVNNKVEKTVQPTKQQQQQPITENQYCSLPVANISKSLQASERIDAKLRLSCYPIEDQNKVYDSIAHFGRVHKKLRQRESYDARPLNKNSIDEKPKEAAFLNVPQNTREITVASAFINNLTPIYNSSDEAHELLRKIDEENASIVSAELNDIENSSSKNCELNETLEKPEKIKISPKSEKIVECISSPDIQIANSIDNIIEETVDVLAVKVNRYANGHHKSYQKAHSKRQFGNRSNDRGNEQRDRLNGNLKVNLSNTLKRRLENKARHNLTDKSSRTSDKIKSAKNPKVQQAILENIRIHITQPNFNMSRPQIMHVIDSKRNLSRSALKNRNKENEMINVNTTVTGQAKKEMLQKVDSVRSYWSKLIQTTDDGVEEVVKIEKTDQLLAKSNDNHTNLNNNNNNKIECERKTTTIAKLSATQNRTLELNKSLKPRTRSDEILLKPPVISVSNNTLKRAASAASGLHSLLYAERDELNSYTPSVEIVELDDQKQAAIVKVQGADSQDFDHVRYKVMKTDTFQKNILTQTRKEAPLDGLLQYLHDYSFQELLTQNNVVIIEPVRTKIEQISNKSNDSQILACKITAGAGKLSDGKNGLRKHFFYHPIRVNKELLDEELPTPDTVRNAKKLFEETLLLCPFKKQASRSLMGLNENCKTMDRKYLTLETFNANNVTGKNPNKNGLSTSGIIYNSVNGNNIVCNRIKKWDSASLSSGISSGDLSSPCDCNDNDETKILTTGNGNELCESYYVSQDILEKIRECGSSVTYYGGRVLNNQSPEVSPMTKAIMREIHSEHNICEVCQPHSNKLFTTFCDSDKDHLGMKLRLIKSNSCNSRLELTGTRFNDGPLHKYCTRNHSAHPEDSVRNIIQRIESNSMQDKRVPRIIESKCIEKAVTDASKSKQQSLHAYRNDDMTGLSKSMEILSQVSVKNHINGFGTKADKLNASNIEKSSKENLVSRNKDVDLAIQMNTKLIRDKTSGISSKKGSKAFVIEKCNGKSMKPGPQTATVRPTSVLTKAELEEKKLKENHKAILQDLCKAVARSEEEKIKKRALAKWDSADEPYEKNYFANDAALKRKPKYDDIEFEEFEVIEPKK